MARRVPALIGLVAVVGCPARCKPQATPAAPTAQRPPVARPAPLTTRCLGPSYALTPDDYDVCADARSTPLMTRWRPLVRRVVGDDDNAFALLMTFIFIESGGRQFAVSRSGCAGLMQFCDATAVRAPFDRIFDLQRLHPCAAACPDRRCRIHWQTRRFLETTAEPLHPVVAHEFPCDLHDARFDPERSIRAGWTYIQRLAAGFGDNIYLIYIGYNAGAHAARRVLRRLGPRRARDLRAIGRVLHHALRPNFGLRARRRARALVDIHLPKVARVFDAYRASISHTPAARPRP